MRLPFINDLPAKQAVRWVLIIGALLVLLAFQFAIRPTITLRSQNNDLNFSALDPVLISDRIKMHQEQLSTIDATIGTGDYDRIVLFDRCGALAEELEIKLLDFAPEKIYHTDAGVKRIINQLSLQGGYKNILKFAYTIEEKEKLSSVLSLSFDYKKDIRTRKQNLIATLYLENLNLSNFE